MFESKQYKIEKVQLLESIKEKFSKDVIKSVIEKAKDKKCDDLQILIFLNIDEHGQPHFTKPVDFLLCRDNYQADEYEVLKGMDYSRDKDDVVLSLHAFTQLNVSKDLFKKRSKWFKDVKNWFEPLLSEFVDDCSVYLEINNLDDEAVMAYGTQNMLLHVKEVHGLKRHEQIGMILIFPEKKE